MAGKEKTVSIQLTYDQLQLLKTWGKTENTLKKQARKMKRLGQQMSLAISAPLGLAAVAAIKQFATFEQSMAKVQAVSGATAKEFEMLTAKALELGRSTIFTAQEVANLELQYSKLGFSAGEIDKITKATLDLALVTGEDLARSAEVAGSTLRGFNLDASEMPRVVDVMAKAFTSSALDLEKFQVSISKIAPIAAATGRSIEEVTAAESVLADTGIEASIIGTSLRKIFGDLAKEGMTYKEAMDQIRNSTAPVVTATKLFDIRAAAAAVSLAFQDEKLNRLLETYKNAGGTTEELSKIMNDTLMVDLKELQSAVQGLGIKFGEVLSPAIRSITDAFTTLAQKIGDLPKPIKIAIAVLGGFLIAIPPIIAMLGQLGLALIGLGTTLTGGLAIIAPYAAAIAGLALLLGGLAVAVYNLKGKYSELTPQIEGVARAEDRHLRFTKLLNKNLPTTKKGLIDLRDKYSDLASKLKEVNNEKIKEIKLSKIAQLEALKELTAKDVTSGAYKFTGQAGNLAYTKQLKKGGLEKKLSKTEEILKRYEDINKKIDEELAKLDTKIALFGTGGGGGGGEELQLSPDIFSEWIDKYSVDAYKNLFPEGTGKLDNGIGRALDKWADDFSKQFELKFDIEAAFPMDKINKIIQKSGEKLKELTSSIESMTESAIVEMSSMLGDMLGRALSGQDISGKEFGRGLLEMIAGFMQQLGALMIAFGVEYAVFEKSVISGNAPLAIAAGIAMVAAGAAIKGALSSGVDGSGGGMTTPSYGGGAGGYGGQDFTTEVKIQGREMIIVQSREKSFRR